ncbi:MAG: trehalose-phosphatase [Alphaproteobacteria bacterium]|nr:MAG: trehalose-phosphatase [Alphaproteobacteria bacterium]
MPALSLPPPLPADAALFLDFDGTLVELAHAPDAIAVPESLRPLLDRLAERLGGRLAVVSGRSLGDLDRHLGSGLPVSGSHGLEIRHSDGRFSAPSPPSGLASARAAVDAFAQATPGLLAEDKPASIALHFRGAPGREGEVQDFAARLAEETGLKLQQGKMVVELRPAGADKGDALRAMMREPQFAGARPWFVGDDLTDEHAFEAAAALGGAGILVGPERGTAAGYRLAGVAEVARWLEEAARG